MTGMHDLTAAERRLLLRLSTPERIQKYLDSLDYNLERGGATYRSPRRVIRDGTAHCAEGAFLAAAAFRMQGRPPHMSGFDVMRSSRPAVGTEHLVKLLSPIIARPGAGHHRRRTAAVKQ